MKCECAALNVLERVGTGLIVSASPQRGIGLSVCGPCLAASRVQGIGEATKYMLYFAHHRGQSIRLATARTLVGPWRIERPVLRLAQTRYSDHLASPTVVCDEGSRLWRLYFHGGDGVSLARQSEGVATSEDGFRFTALSGSLGTPYWSVFRSADRWYALAMPGTLLESRSGLGDFVAKRFDMLPPTARHSTAIVVKDLLLVFYSEIGDCPEHIKMCAFRLETVSTNGKRAELGSVLVPSTEYEGSNLPSRPSRPGACGAPSRDLRDPSALIVDGTLWLAYAAGGERGIGLTRGSVEVLTNLAYEALEANNG